MPMQGQDKYTLFATAHGKAAMQYRARSSALRSSGDSKGAAKHSRIGKLHDMVSQNLLKIAKAHSKEFERGRQAQVVAKTMMDQGQMTSVKENFEKEEVEMTNVVNEALDSLVQSLVERRPSDFAETIADLIQSRVAEKVENLKVEIAQETFNTEEFVDEGKTFRHDEDEGDQKREKFSKRRSERKKREVVDEEVEQLDELDRKTLKSYERKATTSRDREERKGAAEEDKAMSTDGNKYPDKQNRHNANASAHFKKMAQRDRGLAMAKKRLAKEEVEQIDEISSEKAKAYLGKAEGDFQRVQHKITKGNADKSDVQRSKKRFKGIERASFKVNEETGVLTIDFDGEITEEQMQDLEELFGKGKLDGIVRHHNKMRDKHGSSASEYEDEGDQDSFEHHYEKAMDHDNKSQRGEALKRVRDTAIAAKRHKEAKNDARLMNPKRGSFKGKAHR